MTDSSSALAPPRFLKYGEQVVVTIDAVDSDLYGQAVCDGNRLVVAGVFAGETVRVEIMRGKRRRLICRVVEVLTPSPHRVTPQCPHFGVCAGCQLQHMDYAAQLDLKVARLSRLFAEAQWPAALPQIDVVPSPMPYRYRNTITLHGPGEPGFWQVKGIGMLRHRDCAICVEPLDAALAHEREDGFRRFTDVGQHNILLRASSGGDVHVGTEQMMDGQTTWVRERVTNPVTGTVWELDVPVHAFWQGNTPILDRFVAEGVNAVLATAPDVLVEAYCGVGLFGLMAAPAVSEVIGLELNPLSIEAARRNAQRHGLSNIRFVEGHTEAHLRDILQQQQGRKMTLLVDPPRDGLHKKVIDSLLEHPVAHLVYISCGPQALAHNLVRLCAEKYDLLSLKALDLFPQTKHIETIAVLRAKSLA